MNEVRFMDRFLIFRRNFEFRGVFMSANRKFFAALVCMLSALFCGTMAAYAEQPADDLVRMEYNHPGLTDFLAVGLWSWPVPCDADGDGDLDLIVSCEDTPYNGTYLFENPGPADAVFPIFKKAKRLSQGEINVQASWVNGGLRVLTPNREYPDFCATGLEKPVDLGLNPNPHPNRVRGNMWKYVDFNGDGLTDIAVGSDDWTDYGWDNGWDKEGHWITGPLRGVVYILLNSGTNEKPQYAEPFALTTADGERLESFGWPSPCFVDFDGDGDLDLLCGDFRDRFIYFENIGSATEPVYAKARPINGIDGNRLTIELEMATPVVFDWNRDGRPDILCGDEDGRIACFLNSGKFEETTIDGRTAKTPLFEPRVYFRQEADCVKGGSLVSPFVTDFDGDGAEDIVAGNAAGFLLFFKNLSAPGVEFPTFAEPVRLACRTNEGTETFRIIAGPNGSIQGPCEEKWGYFTQSVADWNGDGLPDIILNNIWGRILWLENLGEREHPVFAPAKPIEVDWEGEQPRLNWGWLTPENIGQAMEESITPKADESNRSKDGILTQWRTTPVAYDFNGDGLIDLAVLDTEGYLAFFERYQKEDGSLALKSPKRLFADKEGKPLRLSDGKAGGSGRRKIAVGDYDGDGKFDLVLNSINSDFYRQTEGKDGLWCFENKGPVGTRRLQGHSAHPTFCDFNADGVLDLVIGAEDGHCYYLRNPLAAALNDKTQNADDASESTDAPRTSLTPPAVLRPVPPEYADENRQFQGIASLDVSGGDTLWACWYTGGRDECKDNYILTVVSHDRGETWSKPIFAVDPDGTGPIRVFDPAIWTGPDNVLRLFFAQSNDHDGRWGVWCMTTAEPEKGEDARWSEPVRLCNGIMMNKPICDSLGRWLYPVSLWRLPCMWKDGVKSQFDFGEEVNPDVFVSTDFGRSVRLLGHSCVPAEASIFDEHHLVEMKDGRLKMFVRTVYGIGEAVSGDGGKTWTDVVPSAIQHTTSRFFIRRLKSGNLLLVKNGPIDQDVGRTNLTAFLSLDDGQTWTGGLVLDDRPNVSYPDGGQLSDGTIVIVNDFDRYGAREIVCHRFTEEDVKAGKIVSSCGRLGMLVNKATGAM